MAKRKSSAGSKASATRSSATKAANIHLRRPVVLPEDLAVPGELNRRRVGGFGWKPDPPDPRDQLFSVAGPILQALPSAVDLRSHDTPIYDQGRIGSCTANAIAGAIQFDRRKFHQSPDFVPSRLFIYYNERSIEGSIANDAGAFLRDGIKSINKVGVCPESEWKYDDTPAIYDGGPFPAGARAAKRPPATAYRDAKQYELVTYQRLVPTLAQLKGALASGFPFVFGFSVFENLYDSSGRPKTHIPVPDGSRMIGGHAVMVLGYNDTRHEFTIRNSWGTDIGAHGYFFMPYSYVVSSYASDFWVIRGMSH